MVDFTTVSALVVDGAEAVELYADGKLAWSSLPDEVFKCNQYAYSLLSDNTVAETKAYSGTSYSIYMTFEADAWCNALSSGQTHPYVLSPTTLGYAAHYGSLPAAIYDASGTQHQVVSSWNVQDYALQNGWTADELSGAWLSDLAVLSVEDTILPLSSCPWLMSEDYAKSHVQTHSLSGTVAWRVSQDTAYVVPVILCSQSEWYAMNNSSHVNDIWTRGGQMDFMQLSCTKQSSYPVYVGDSGKPVFIKLDDGKQVLVNQYYMVQNLGYSCCGPNMLKAAPVLAKLHQELGAQVNVLS